MPQNDNHAFRELVTYLKQTRRFDFGGYKTASLQRRVERRMSQIPIATFDDYIDYLEVHPEEFGLLFNTILINVTDFFRDPTAWEGLRQDALPRILARKQNDEPIRIWSAGCASGQEAYTLAMLFAEAMPLAEFQDRVKIYATDADEEALVQARRAEYTAKEIAAVPKPYLTKYFEFDNGRYVFRSDLRRTVIFGRHDLSQDAPISRLDLLACRNALMYFNAEAQNRILLRMHFALNNGGFLFLGRAEMMMNRSSLFAPVNLKARLFSKISNNSRERLLEMTQPDDMEDNSQFSEQLRIREAALDASPLAQLVVDTNGVLILVNERARKLFGLTRQDIGRPLQDLEVSYRPVELRSLIEQAYSERRVVAMTEVPRISQGENQFLNLQVVPLQSNGDALLGVIISFMDVSHAHVLQEELRRTSRDLEKAYQELESSNQELETTNEELQSANEELETTNEELQSSNEELETMNEELQSSNEELHTVNEELRQRTGEFNQINGWLQSVLSIPPAALIVVDRNLNVVMWNQHAEEMWGFRADEVKGKSLFTVDISLPLISLGAPIRATLDRHEKDIVQVLDTVNRRGRPFKCKVTISPFGDTSQHDVGVALMMEDVTESERLVEALEQNQTEVRALLENLPTIVLAEAADGTPVYWSPEAERVTGWSAGEIVNNPRFLDLLYPDASYRTRLLDEREHLGNDYHDWQVDVTAKDGTHKSIVWSSRARQLPVPGWKQWAIGVVTDAKP